MKNFEIIAKVIDNNNEFDEGFLNKNNIGVFKYQGNKRSSEKSIIRNFKSDMRFLNANIIEIIEFREINL